MKGLIFNIKRYSVHDGPGIRVTFFLKGCPLRCKWCHNPEGISPLIQQVRNRYRVGDKEFIRTENVGKYYTAYEILNILEREKVFMDKSGGGVTFSGGEPMQQTGFLREVLEACKSEGYHTAIDTSGYSQPEYFRSIIPFTDLFLFDIKHLDDEMHIQGTGVSNSLILENYRLLLNEAREVGLRIPLIPGYNDDMNYIERLIEHINSTKTESLSMISLLPFHKTGISKYRRFNIPYSLEKISPPSKSYMHEVKEKFLSAGIRVKTGG